MYSEEDVFGEEEMLSSEVQGEDEMWSFPDGDVVVKPEGAEKISISETTGMLWLLARGSEQTKDLDYSKTRVGKTSRR